MPTPDYAASLAFLQRWQPDGPWLLTAISLDKKSIVTQTFRDPDACTKWLQLHGETRNIYFHVNPCKADMNKKAEREDIAALAWLHVDVDPRAGEDIEAERQRALDLLQSPPPPVPPPTAIVFSGGGYQGFWKLRDPFPINGEVDKYEEAKRYNQQLELLFGADHCHNVDRIMRLPGTINRPDARKVKKGRTATLATLTEWHDDRIYDLSAFTPAPVVQSPSDAPGLGGSMGPTSGSVQVSGNVNRLDTVDDLPDLVTDRTKVVIVQGNDPDNPFPSRSEALFYVCCQLVRANVDDDTIFAVVTDPDFGISDSVLEKGSSAERYAIRQIERAREEAIDPKLRELNELHAIISDINGKCRVLSEVYDHAMNRPRMSLQSFEDFRNRYMHRQAVAGTDAKGNPVSMPLGKWWLMHPNRRQYETMLFVPGREVPNAYNLWKGFSCDACPGDWSMFREHIFKVLCGEKEELFNYLIGWMARAVQHPDTPGYSAIVLRGERGTGKTFFADNFGALFGRHYLMVSDSKHLVGNFNAHLRDCSVLFGDEAFFAGDKSHESVLKTIISSDTLFVEPKGIDALPSPNYLHIILASNDKWVVPAGFKERRFLVLDVSQDHIQDTKHFAEMQRQMNNGGHKALLHFLLSYDLSNFDVRTVPDTTALREQKIFSFSPEEEWWYNKLCEGRVLAEHDEWRTDFPCEDLLSDYVNYVSRFGVMRRGNATRMGQFLHTAMSSITKIQRREPIEVRLIDGTSKVVNRPYYYKIPSLENCRAHWDQEYGGPYDWPKEVEVAEDRPAGDNPPF